MKILALGGCGAMGRHAVRTLLPYDFVQQIVIADIDKEHAERFASECGAKAAARYADVTSPDSLAQAMQGMDLVMNTTGPYYRFGVPILQAAIGAGCHYFDINDDWEPTLAMLDLHAQAQAAGVTAVIGFGATPGISNMLAVQAIRELDTVHELYTGWHLDKAKPAQVGPQATAATVHGIHQLSGSIRSFEAGSFADARPIQKLYVDYPGFGRHPAWTIGHPETVTFPRYYPSLQRSANIMTAPRSTILGLHLISAAVNRGLLTVERAAHLAEKIEGPGHASDWQPQTMLEALLRKPSLPPLFALAVGQKQNKEASVGAMVTSAPAGGMGGITGVSLAVGVILQGQGAIDTPGVFAAEGVVDPDQFMQVLAEHCTPRRTSGAALVYVTRSWDTGNIAADLAALMHA